MAYQPSVNPNWTEAEDVFPAALQGVVDQAVIDAAVAAGVTKVPYLDYEVALGKYEARTDVEPLAQRRAREAGDQFSDTTFRRQGDGRGIITSPSDANGTGTQAV
jgi:hypothetical protein